MVPIIAAVLFVVLVQGPQPVFQIDLWPGEGRPVFEATSSNLKLREFPSAASKIDRILSVSPKQRISFDDTRYQTIEVGHIRALRTTRVTGRMLGVINVLSREDYYKGKFAAVTLEVQPGVDVEYLQDRAESTCFVRIAGKVIEADSCPPNDKAMFRVETEPKTEWWIHVLTSRNDRGWVLVTDSSVKVVNREF